MKRLKTYHLELFKDGQPFVCVYKSEDRAGTLKNAQALKRELLNGMVGGNEFEITKVGHNCCAYLTGRLVRRRRYIPTGVYQVIENGKEGIKVLFGSFPRTSTIPMGRPKREV